MPQQQPERHPFIKAWLQDLSEEVDEGWYKVVPFWLLSFLAIAGAVAYFLPEAFWTERRDNGTLFYASIMTMNGIILALSWGAFAKIYDTLSAPNFSTFLHKNKVLDKFLFFVSYVHFTQIIALVASASALVAMQFDEIEVKWQRIVLAAVVAFAAYAIKTAGGSVTVMHQLIRYRAIFDCDPAASNNVHRL